ncbi:WD repeat-containing protein 88-like [Boleophthalmus pectinirostris]|uniref:WD repeat-containing protein 88-like n=1 Tax=Boleophthalmus pectinirostris TaxID=150288 RepID=UPI002430B96D|nr:WD repeat-containing protein 88-like [Boleophthalmus pectinirostris]
MLLKVPIKTLRAHTDSATAARFCLSDTHFVNCSSSCTARLWEVESCRPVRDFPEDHERTITECAMIPDTNRMVTVSWDKKMVAWDMETGQMLAEDGSCSVSSVRTQNSTLLPSPTLEHSPAARPNHPVNRLEQWQPVESVAAFMPLMGLSSRATSCLKPCAISAGPADTYSNVP